MTMIFDKVRELSALFLETPEVKEYLKTVEQLQKDNQAQKLLHQYEKIQKEINHLSIKEKQEVITQLNEIELEIKDNVVFQKILKQEKQINKMIEQITGILEFSIPKPLFPASSCNSGCFKKRQCGKCNEKEGYL